MTTKTASSSVFPTLPYTPVLVYDALGGAYASRQRAALFVLTDSLTPKPGAAMAVVTS